MLTDFEQRIYNCYLATTRSALGKPFTLRKDFSDFNESDPNYRWIKKLSGFFVKFPQVDMRTYFRAPFEIYKDGESYDLKFFATQKAISLYSMYTKRLQEQSPDTPEQLQSIKSSLAFIIKFCAERKIPFNDYISYKSPGGSTEDFLSHYKNREVNLYVLLKLPGFERTAYSLDEELRALFFGETLDKLTSFKIKLHQSTQAKQLIESTIKKAVQVLQ
jgi:hypothetical protein